MFSFSGHEFVTSGSAIRISVSLRLAAETGRGRARRRPSEKKVLYLQKNMMKMIAFLALFLTGVLVNAQAGENRFEKQDAAFEQPPAVRSGEMQELAGPGFEDDVNDELPIDDYIPFLLPVAVLLLVYFKRRKAGQLS